jgi:hypothetical protein
VAARMTLARHHVGVGGCGVRRCGAAQAEGEPRPGNRTPPVGAVAVSPVIVSRCEAMRAARHHSVRAYRERRPEHRQC